MRHTPVARTPEECVRQNLLRSFFTIGGYPEHLTRVEMPLDFFAPPNACPQRRLDIVCFYKKSDALLPLLIVECKASVPQARANLQLFGYNFHAKAPFTALAWQDSIILYHGKTLCYEGGFQDFPTYQGLLQKNP